MVLTSLQLQRTTCRQNKMAPQNANKRRRTMASSKANAAEIDDFPCWAKGTVWIEVSQDPTHQYQLHKAVLERNSTWFAAELEKTIFDPGVRRKSHLKDTVRYLFRPKPAADAEKPVLRRVVSSRYKKQRKAVAYFACSSLASGTLWCRQRNHNDVE